MLVSGRPGHFVLDEFMASCKVSTQFVSWLCRWVVRVSHKPSQEHCLIPSRAVLCFYSSDPDASSYIFIERKIENLIRSYWDLFPSRYLVFFSSTL